MILAARECCAVQHSSLRESQPPGNYIALTTVCIRLDARPSVRPSISYISSQTHHETRSIACEVKKLEPQAKPQRETWFNIINANRLNPTVHFIITALRRHASREISNWILYRIQSAPHQSETRDPPSASSFRPTTVAPPKKQAGPRHRLIFPSFPAPDVLRLIGFYVGIHGAAAAGRRSTSRAAMLLIWHQSNHIFPKRLGWWGTRSCQGQRYIYDVLIGPAQDQGLLGDDARNTSFAPNLKTNLSRCVGDAAADDDDHL